MATRTAPHPKASDDIIADETNHREEIRQSPDG